MGKVRKRKGNNPKIKESLEQTEEEEIIMDSKETLIQTMIDQILSANVEEKYCGLQTFALHIEDPETLQKMISRDLVKIVAPLILDAAGSIRNAASGSLRNLSALGLDMCDLLMENDIMTPLICYFHQYTESWTPDSNSKTNTEDIDTFIQCVNLLLNLCESSDIAIKYLGDSRVLDILPRYLELSTFGADIVKAVLQCFYVVLEDNPKAIEKIKQSSEHHLRMLVDSDKPLLKTLTAGILIHLYGGNIEVVPVNLINEILAILANALDIDHRSACHELSSSVPVGNEKGKEMNLKGKEAQILGAKVETVLQIIDAHQYAIEIIANMCSCEGRFSKILKCPLTKLNTSNFNNVIEKFGDGL